MRRYQSAALGGILFITTKPAAPRNSRDNEFNQRNHRHIAGQSEYATNERPGSGNERIPSHKSPAGGFSIFQDERCRATKPARNKSIDWFAAGK